MTLAEIGRRNFTEKANLGFLDIYEEYWEPLQDRPITLLELGVYNGNSMRTWCEYFSNARIIGVDKHHNPGDTDHQGVVHYGDQSDSNFLYQLIDKYGEFDIVIDDASHMWLDQQISFEILWKHTKYMYIIEDLQTSADKFWQKHTEINTIDYLKGLVDGVVLDSSQDIKQLNFYNKLAIFFKKSAYT